MRRGMPHHVRPTVSAPLSGNLNSVVRESRIRAVNILQEFIAVPKQCGSGYEECPYCHSHAMLQVYGDLQELAVDVSRAFHRLQIPTSNGKQ